MRSDPAMSQAARRAAVRLLLVPALLLGFGALPSPSQDQFGRPPASLEAAKAPAIAARRAQLMNALQDGIVIIPSQVRARDGLRDNLNFYYLTGLREAEAVLVLDSQGSSREILFRRTGAGPGGRGSAGAGADGPEGRAAAGSGNGAGAGQTAAGPGVVEKPVTELATTLFGMVRNGRIRRAYLPFSDFDFLARMFGASVTPNPLAQSDALLNVDPFLAEMRLTKDADEIAALRESIDLTADALNEAYRAAGPGMREVDLAAILRFAFERKETKDSFLQAASGPNSTNVHFGATPRPLAAGDLIVFDVGAYIRGYTSDISRTIPANGRFTKAQRDIYALVLEAEKTGCAKLIPGVTFKAVQTEVEDILMAGLEKLGLVTDVKSPWQRRLYIQHGFGHGIGLDIHDSLNWHGPRLDKVVMAPGMVMTMEPGLYFPEDRFDAFLDALKGKAPEEEIAAFRGKVGPVYKKYAGIGVRIEDDVLITAAGNEVLSGSVPKEIPEIEKLMREKSPFNQLK